MVLLTRGTVEIEKRGKEMELKGNNMASLNTPVPRPTAAPGPSLTKPIPAPRLHLFKPIPAPRPSLVKPNSAPIDIEEPATCVVPLKRKKGQLCKGKPIGEGPCWRHG